jgi:hypothetical protein
MTAPAPRPEVFIDSFGDVTNGRHGKALTHRQIVTVINGLRDEVSDMQARVDALMDENTELRRERRVR